MQNNLANGKTVINKLKSLTSVNIVPKSVNIVQRPTPVSYARRVIPKTWQILHTLKTKTVLKWSVFWVCCYSMVRKHKTASKKSMVEQFSVTSSLSSLFYVRMLWMAIIAFHNPDTTQQVFLNDKYATKRWLVDIFYLSFSHLVEILRFTFWTSQENIVYCFDFLKIQIIDISPELYHIQPQQLMHHQEPAIFKKW